MKRWGILILVCLLLGVISTYGSAWALYMWGTSGDEDFTQVGEDVLVSGLAVYVKESDSAGPWRYINYLCPVPPTPAAGLPEYRMPDWSRFNAMRTDSARDRRSLLKPELLTLWESDFQGEKEGSEDFYEEVLGWPLPALWCASVVGYSFSDVADFYDGYTVIYGSLRSVRLAGSNGLNEVPEYYNLPVRPLWGGLLIDSSIYAVLWSGLYGVCRFAVRTCVEVRRTRRGLCAKCGYDLTGNQSGTCPECGSATTARAASS